jgi:hypothetical protein
MELIVIAFMGIFALLLAHFAAYVGTQIFGTHLYTGRSFQWTSLPRPKTPPRAPRQLEEDSLRSAA